MKNSIKFCAAFQQLYSWYYLTNTFLTHVLIMQTEVRKKKVDVSTWKTMLFVRIRINAKNNSRNTEE